MINDYYIYKVTHKITNEYYIGLRSRIKDLLLDLDWIEKDFYFGSQQGWKEIKNLSQKEKSLIFNKEILRVLNQVTQEYASSIEMSYILKYIKDEKNKNYTSSTNGGWPTGNKNPSSISRKNKIPLNSIVFFRDEPYRLNQLLKFFNLEELYDLVKNKHVLYYKDYLKGNFYNHTKKLVIFNEVKSALEWCADNRLNIDKTLKSTGLLKWYLEKNNINYREITKAELLKILSTCQIGIKKPGVSLAMKINNPSKRQDVRDKISKATKGKKKKVNNSSESREKRRLSRIGKKHSKETREKMSISNKKAWEKRRVSHEK